MVFSTFSTIPGIFVPQAFSSSNQGESLQTWLEIHGRYNHLAQLLEKIKQSTKNFLRHISQFDINHC
jgi:hypothetical protein